MSAYLDLRGSTNPYFIVGKSPDNSTGVRLKAISGNGLEIKNSDDSGFYNLKAEDFSANQNYATADGALRLNNGYSGGGRFQYDITAPQSGMSGAVTLTLPTDAGTNGYVLSTNGSGVLSWVAQSAVSSLQIFNNVLALDGSTGPINGLLLWKAPLGSSFSTIILQIYELNGVASGNLEIDIKLNSTPNNTGMTSIFTTKPIIDFSTATDYEEDSGTISITSFGVGDYLRLDLTQIPASFVGFAQIVAYA